MAFTQSSGSGLGSALRSRRALALASGAVVLIVGAIAFPRFLGPGADDDLLAVATPVASAAQRAASDARDARAAERAEEGPDATAADATALASDAGAATDGEPGELDLAVAAGLRWKSYPYGSAIHAEITLANHTADAFHLPAPDEPQPTLALVVLDEAGRTVRRVVEGTTDSLPRRMRRLAPGAASTLKLDVLATGDEPLPPGTYDMFAVYAADRVWTRSGLRVWSAPNGPRQSDRVRFEITLEE